MPKNSHYVPQPRVLLTQPRNNTTDVGLGTGMAVEVWSPIPTCLQICGCHCNCSCDT